MLSEVVLQRTQRRVLIVVMLSSFLMPLVAYSIGPLAPFLRTALTLTREQIGVLMSLFFGGTALACVSAGWATDRWGVRRFFVACQLIAGLPLLAMPLWPTYEGLCLAAGLAGLGFGTNTGVTSKALADWFPSASRATAFGAKLLAFSLAGLLPSAVLPTLILHCDWPIIVAGIGALQGASGVLTWLLYCERVHDGTVGVRRYAPGEWRVLLSDGNFWRLALVGLLFGSAQFAFVTYLALFLYESWGLSAVLAGSMLAQAQLLAAGCRLPAGWISDRWFQGDRRPMMGVFGLLGVVAMLILLFLPQGTAYPVLILGVLLYGIGGLSWGNTYMAMVSEAPRAAKGLGIGIGNAVPHTGAMLITPLFGRVADMTGSYTLAWGLIMVCLLVAVSVLRWVQIPAPARAAVAPLSPTPVASAD